MTVCCFRSLKPMVIAIVAVVANAIAFFFLIWKIAEAVWLDYQKALYIIGFVLVLLSLFGTIGILILILVRNNQNYVQLDKIGKIICFATLIVLAVGMLFAIISSIAILVKYGQVTGLPARYWVAVIIPLIFLLAGGIVTILCLLALTTIFGNHLNSSIEENIPMVPGVPQNTIPTVTVTQNPIDQMNPQFNKGMFTGGTTTNNNIVSVPN